MWVRCSKGSCKLVTVGFDHQWSCMTTSKYKNIKLGNERNENWFFNSNICNEYEVTLDGLNSQAKCWVLVFFLWIWILNFAQHLPLTLWANIIVLKGVKFGMNYKIKLPKWVTISMISFGPWPFRHWIDSIISKIPLDAIIPRGLSILVSSAFVFMPKPWLVLTCSNNKKYMYQVQNTKPFLREWLLDSSRRKTKLLLLL